MQYVLLAPWVAHGWYEVATKGWREVDLGYIAILPSLLLRMLHNQAWITISRLQNARGRRQIVRRGIEFDQVDRERNWYAKHHKITYNPRGVFVHLRD